MPTEDALIEQRKNKHQEANGGTYPLEEFCPPLGKVKAFMDLAGKDAQGNLTGVIPMSIDPKELGDENIWKVHGRVTAFRKSGALTFIKLSDMSDSLQIIVSRASFPDYDKLRLIDFGDIIHVEGRACFSKTGEYSLLMDNWRMVTKAHRPPPEKFAGIADQELKYRKRYLDLMSSEETRARFVARSLTIRAIREFMDDRNFLEVETSTLNAVSSGANAKPFTTHHNSLEMDLFLRIAPELYLKRLLVGGFERVYEIGRNYRNEGVSTRHNPEFTMMESYQAYGTFPQLIDQTKELLQYIDDYVSDESHWIHRHVELYQQERTFTLSEFKEQPMLFAVRLACERAEIQHDLDNLAGRLMYPTANDVGNLVVKNLNNPRLQKIDMVSLFYELNECQSVGAKIGVMFEYIAEPFLTEDYRSADGTKSVPVFITQYPKELCPLARTSDKYPAVCDRFELFVDGRELCNAFQELNDPDEQAARFQEQLETNNKDPMDFDDDYIEALECGMPPAIGFGMGIDRLVMLLTNAATIKDVILFPTLKPIK
jgi:lysyl-tRNA synthetase class 2